MAGEMLLNFDGMVNGTALDDRYISDAVEAVGVRVGRLQLDGRPHGFGYMEDWFDAYDSFLADVFPEQ